MALCKIRTHKTFEHRPPKMVKYTQTIRRQQPTNWLSVFDHLLGLALKVLRTILAFTLCLNWFYYFPCVMILLHFYISLITHSVVIEYFFVCLYYFRKKPRKLLVLINKNWNSSCLKLLLSILIRTFTFFLTKYLRIR